MAIREDLVWYIFNENYSFETRQELGTDRRKRGWDGVYRLFLLFVVILSVVC